MRHCLFAFLGSALLTLPSFAQSSPAPTTVLQAGTQLVVVDVVAQDKSGNPIHGLKASDFQISESGTQQAIRNFEEHTPNSIEGPASAPVNLPPGTFTNFTAIKPSETLNVLLLDALNTPTSDQSFVRTQLLKYVQNAPAGTHLAIFGLNTHLTLLQSFTADPAILKDAVEHKLIPRVSTLLDDPTGVGTTTASLSDQMQAQGAAGPQEAASLAMISANVADFEAESNSFQTGLRVQYTLDAFNTLAHYLGAFQGRKNLIWFSGSFPITVLPDPTSNRSVFAGMESKSEEFEQTSALLSRAQVAVYPIDARGLMNDVSYAASASGTGTRANPRTPTWGNSKLMRDQADEHGTMDDLADSTGGRAFYNTNSLAEATRKAIDAGSNYYTLTYSPTDHRQDSSFRKIHVSLTDGKSATLSYRKGYIAEKPAAPVPESASTLPNAAKPAAPTLTPEQEAARHSAMAYAHAAMAHGGPTPEDVLFKVRVLPASTTPEAAIAPGNQLGNYKVSGPYQRFDLDFVTIPTSFKFPLQPDGKHAGGLEFLAFVYTSDGRILNTADKAVAVHLTPENYPRFLNEPIQYHLEVSAPASTETYLRIAVRDVVTNRFGVVEIPASTVVHLTPPVYPVAPKPASPPATQTPPTTAPSNPATSFATPPR